jgi:hypothetical protein
LYIFLLGPREAAPGGLTAAFFMNKIGNKYFQKMFWQGSLEATPSGLAAAYTGMWK